MFAKQAQIAVAALAFAVAGSAFAAEAQRNVFDTETDLRAPAAETKLTREQVRAEFLAARASGEVNVFDTETVAYVKPVVRNEQTRLAKAANK